MEHRLAGRLKDALGAAEWELLQRVAGAAQELRMPLYVVGGVPRDLLLGQPIGDLDLVVEGDAQALARLLRHKHGGKVTLHGKFATAKWEPQEGRGEAESAVQPVDLITARSESYRHPAALPTVQAGTIEDDLRRRDFTINALAIRLDAPHMGEVRDDFGGWEDIQAGVVRVLHEDSFVDDPTRMYRAVRYEQRYGFRIAGETLALIPAARPVVAKLSAQRVRHELDLLLDEHGAAAMLSRLDELDLLSAIHPALSFDGEARRRMSAVAAEMSEWPLAELRWLSWLMALSEADIEGIERRLHFHAARYRALLAASELWHEADALAGAAPSRWAERLDGIPLAAVYAVSAASPQGPVREAMGQYLRTWRHIKPKTTGHDLKGLGLEPGVQYKTILGELRRAWLDGDITNADEEREHLKRLMAEATRK